MFFGKHTMWRLLSPLVALLWVVAAVGFARSAAADAAAGHLNGARGDQTSNVQDHADATPRGPSSEGSTDKPTPPAPASRTDAQRGGTSGDTSNPQPISKADANTGGANGQCPDGPYCSTRDGSASANGNGGGKATGRPCAGCVGKADNKNPRGQMPGPADHNAGYECDTNHGIAKGNPAHTRCLTPAPNCVPTETVPCVPTPPCVPTETVPCVPCVPTETVPCVPSSDCVPTETVPCVPCVPTETVPCVPNPPCVPADGPPCVPSSDCVPTETVPCVPSSDCVPTETVPCVPNPPGACVVTPTESCGTQVEAPVLGVSAAAGGPTATRAPSAGVLPETGAASTLLWLTAGALGCLLAGVSLLAHGRRRAARPPAS